MSSTRTTTPPRVIHCLQRNHWNMTWAFARRPVSQQQRSLFREKIERCIFVSADDVGAWFKTNPSEDWRPGVTLGPGRLPYPLMWIETNWPGGEVMQHGKRRFLPPAAQAFMLEEEPSPTGPRIMAMSFVMRNNAVALSDVIEIQKMTESGEKLDSDTSYGVVPLTREAFPFALEQREDGRLMSLEGLVVVGFMNCKNVTTEREDPPATKPGKRGDADQRRELKQFDRIVIPGSSRTSSPAEGRAAAGSPIAAHMVRGHFKRYTEERPLLGKFVGDYWWGHHVRAGDTAAPKKYEVRLP